MPTLKELIRSDIEESYSTDEFADELAYTPYGAEESARIRAILTYGGGSQAMYEFRVADTYGINATMRVAAFGDYGLESASNGDTLIIDGRTWKVDRAHIINDGLEWMVEITPDE